MISNKKEVIETLNELGLEIENNSAIDGGINNTIYKIRDNNGEKYCLKMYSKDVTEDGGDRYLNERIFMRYAHKYSKSRIPKIMHENNEERWIIMEWIQGDKLKSLNRENIREIGKFICDLNNRGSKYDREGLNYATGYFRNVQQLIENIERRMKEIINNGDVSPINQEAAVWIKSNIQTILNKRKNELEQIGSDDKYNNREWIASPSDMGIHNMIITAKGLKFIDFEYGGRDDICKLVADLVVQPRHRLNERDEIELIRGIKGATSESEASWRIRYENLKILISIKWTMIMLKKARNEIINSEDLERAMSYFVEMNQ